MDCIIELVPLLSSFPFAWARGKYPQEIRGQEESEERVLFIQLPPCQGALDGLHPPDGRSSYQVALSIRLPSLVQVTASPLLLQGLGVISAHCSK